MCVTSCLATATAAARSRRDLDADAVLDLPSNEALHVQKSVFREKMFSDYTIT